VTEPEQVSDATLLVGVARWHEPSLAEIYRRHGGAVHGMAWRVLRSDPPAEEITQEIFTDLWRLPQRFDAQRGSLRSYLLRCTYGKSVDYVRSEVARRRREVRSSHQTSTADVDIHLAVWDLAVADQVNAAVDALPTELRQPIQLAYFGGHTYQQVARILHEPEGTIKSRIHSGLGRLRLNLIELGIDTVGPED
jgi:RNA polymerase sigma-70 factor, ECF subfamily